MKIEPNPTLEETAAIMAALDVLCEKQTEKTPSRKRRRWRVAGLFGYSPPMAMKLEGSLWAYSGWREMV